MKKNNLAQVIGTIIAVLLLPTAVLAWGYFSRPEAVPEILTNEQLEEVNTNTVNDKSTDVTSSDMSLQDFKIEEIVSDIKQDQSEEDSTQNNREQRVLPNTSSR